MRVSNFLMQKEDLSKALRHLRKDRDIKRLISRYPKPDYTRRRNVYQSLVQAIIHQQLSGKASETIYKRFTALYREKPFPLPEQVLKTTGARLRSAGLSAQKSLYIKDLSLRFLDGTIQPKLFPRMSDEEIREHLIAVKGIGRWSADMFLMFTLNRSDVLPVGDLGIQKGFQRLFTLPHLPDAKNMEARAESWRPYRTVACWYLWRLADDGNTSR